MSYGSVYNTLTKNVKQIPFYHLIRYCNNKLNKQKQNCFELHRPSRSISLLPSGRKKRNDTKDKLGQKFQDNQSEFIVTFDTKPYKLFLKRIL